MNTMIYLLQKAKAWRANINLKIHFLKNIIKMTGLKMKN